MKDTDKRMRSLAGSDSQVYLVSACLVGLKTRYDGQVKSSAQCIKALSGVVWLPLCPEQLGGLSTPREPADLVGGDGGEVLAGRARVVTRSGKDVTESFIRGAEQVLAVAKANRVAGVFLKAKSPSCGVTPQYGVTAALLVQHGFTVREF